MKVRWIVQNNLVPESELRDIEKTCHKIGADHFEMLVIPFTPFEELPKFPIDKEHTNFYFGSTTLMYGVYNNVKPVGLFFNENFSMENYIKVWGEHMLSSEAQITTFEQFSKQSHDKESLWFIRPDADDKSFVGEVKSFEEIVNWSTTFAKYDNVILNEKTKIIVGPPYNLKKEWRNYIVDGKVVTSSQYRENFRLKKTRLNIPQEMLDFVEARCKEYMPHKCFAMDVAYCGDSYYIIECGCLNSVGLYDCDVPKLVEAITAYTSSLE